jgi:hypothetical protein
MLVPYNQHVGRDRTVAGHVALRGWLATRLDDRLGLLTRGCSTAVLRHQTLRATLDWSYETLRRAERTALLIGESPVNFVAKRDLKPLDGTVQRFAERGVPHVETKCLRGVAGGNALVAQ